MEIPVINRISNLEAAISSLQNPSVLSQLLSLSGIDRIPRICSFWKWGALIVAFLASFSTIINNIKILVLRFQKEAPASASTSNNTRRPLLDETDDFDDFSSSDSDGVDSNSDDDEDEDPAREVVTSATHYVFRVKGLENHWQHSRGSNLRRRRSISKRLSELAASSKSVVKLWENLGLGLGFKLDGDSSSGNFVLETHGARARVNLSSYLPPPAMIFSSAATRSPAASLQFLDPRASSKKPAILAEWRPQVGDVDSVSSGGVAMLCLRDGGELAAVGDLRKASAPLDNVAESDVGR